MKAWRVALLAAIALALGAFFALGLNRYFTFDALVRQHEQLASLVARRPLSSASLYFAIYVGLTALSLPGAALMTLLGGALFGLGWGTVIVSFASVSGATLAFLAARFVFRAPLQHRFGKRLEAIDRGFARDGAFYLFTLRLVPVFPFFLVNLLVALTVLPTRTFWWVSQVGMLPGTLLYVNAGTQIGRLDSLAGIVSPALLASFAALGLLPLAARRLVEWLRARRARSRWQRPLRFDRNLIVIGAGSAGLVTAYIAAAVKAKVTLIERNRMGGDCLNTGCVPSKALIRTAKLLHQAARSSEFGIRKMDAEFDFADVMRRIQRVIGTIEPHDSVARYTALGVDCLTGEARLASPWEVEVRHTDGRLERLTARHIVIATGSEPVMPGIPGIDSMGCLTSDTVWSLRRHPGRLMVLGGGPIGCELAQAFARLDVPVVLVEIAPRLMTREDIDISQFVVDTFVAEGVDVRLSHRVLRFERRGDSKVMIAEHDGAEVVIAFDTLLCALGRRASTEALGLEALGIGTRPDGTIAVDEYLRTAQPSVLACGDVAGPWQFTHAAAHMAWHAAVNALFGGLRRFRVDWSVLPRCTFVDPEVARVGLNEQEARERGIAFEVTRYDLAHLDRAIVDEAARGFVKVLTEPGRDRILGAAIVGEHAGELIAEYTIAMKQRIGLSKILGTIHLYPSMAEANKYAAGEWRRAHSPERVLRWLARWHVWRLGAS